MAFAAVMLVGRGGRQIIGNAAAGGYVRGRRPIDCHGLLVVIGVIDAMNASEVKCVVLCCVVLWCGVV